MRSYAQAQALVGTTVLASYTNARVKRLKFRQHATRPLAVEAVLFDTAVVTFLPNHVEVQTGGYVTPTTFDGIAAALDEPRVICGTAKRVPYVFATRMREGMMFTYDREPVETTLNLAETPLGPGRRSR